MQPGRDEARFDPVRTIAASRARRFGVLCAFVAVIPIEPALAQATADPQPSEIVVTAQKREEAINRVGMSIDAMLGDDLRPRGIDSVAELDKIAPGLTFTQTPFGPPVLTLRGVGFYDSALAATPAVSLYVDEAPLALPVFAQVAVFDVERVEILKGPQGTLFGENSTGGAINYVIARPTADFSAGGMASFGRFSTVEAEAYVSGPLTSTLGARLAVRTIQSGDWQRSHTRSDTLGETHQGAARLLLDWQPSPAVRLSLNLNGWRDTSDSQAFQLAGVACTVPQKCAPDLLVYPLAPENARAADWDAGSPMKVDDSFGQAVLRADVEIGSGLRLTSISGYQRLSQDKFIDADATALLLNSFRQEGHATTFNQELRLAGDSGTVDWILGGYYSSIDVREHFSGRTDFVSANEPLPGLFPPFPTSEGRYTFRTRSYAGFGHLEYALTERLKLSAGLRYTRSVQRFAACTGTGEDPTLGRLFAYLGAMARGELPAVPPPPECIQFDKDTLEQKESRDRLAEDNISYRLGLDYRTRGDTLLYANLSKGYKSGSFSNVPASNSIQFEPARQESVLAVEAGIKAPLASGATRIEGAVFWYDYRNKQLRGRILDPFFGALETLVNIPQSRVRGAELGISTRPLAGLTLSASATWVDSRVDEFTGITPTGQTSNFRDSSFPYAPRWQAVADAQYEWAPTGRHHAFIGANINWHGETWAALGEDDAYRLRPYLTLDLRAGFGPANGRWQIAAYAQNVTNRYYWNNIFQYIDTRFRIAARPATYGVRFSVRY